MKAYRQRHRHLRHRISPACPAGTQSHSAHPHDNLMTTLGGILSPVSLRFHRVVVSLAWHALIGQTTLVVCFEMLMFAQNHVFFPRVEGKWVPEWAYVRLFLRKPGHIGDLPGKKASFIALWLLLRTLQMCNGSSCLLPVPHPRPKKVGFRGE